MTNNDKNKIETYINSLNSNLFNTRSLLEEKVLNYCLTLLPMSEIQINKNYIINLINNKIYNDIVEESVQTYIREAVRHFLYHANDRTLEDTNRYFYNYNQLLTFAKEFKIKSGDENNIRIGIVFKHDKNIYKGIDRICCYEVTPRRIWDKYRKLCYAESKIPELKIDDIINNFTL